MKTIIILLAILFSSHVSADVEVTWMWTEVTEDVFDNPITIDKYIFRCNTSPNVEFPSTQFSHTETLPPGTHACNVSVVPVNGIESEISNTIVKIVDGEPPEIIQAKPTVLSVN